MGGTVALTDIEGQGFDDLLQASVPDRALKK